MSILDIFKFKTIKKERDEYKERYESIIEMIKSETGATSNWDIQDKLKDITDLFQKKQELEQKIDELSLLELDYEYALYRPQHNFATALQYKEKLNEIREQQRLLIKNKSACIFPQRWTLNGSLKEGKKITAKHVKALIRCFNNECNDTISKSKYNNLEQLKVRLKKSFDQLNTLFEMNEISITQRYLNLKIDELYLAYEYELKKQEEKEILREQREQEKEEKALQREINEKRKKITKEISHISTVIKEMENRLNNTNDIEEKERIEAKINELKKDINDYQNEEQELDYRLQNTGAGYVYIISNIGAFGDNVFKIGVTRRLDPLERISELSSASVPFKFDVHALIFSNNAYQLENELHKHFNEYRVNKVNNRKEFFYASIEDIELALNQYKDLTIEFNKEAEAEEYYQSITPTNDIHNT